VLRRDGVFCHWSAHDRPVAERLSSRRAMLTEGSASATLLGRMINERSISHETREMRETCKSATGLTRSLCPPDAAIPCTQLRAACICSRVYSIRSSKSKHGEMVLEPAGIVTLIGPSILQSDVGLRCNLESCSAGAR
jgi:hypothetical protein